MINLLPKEKKSELLREYRFGWVRILFFALGLSSIIGIAFLAPAFAAVSYRSALFRSDSEKIEERIMVLEKEKNSLPEQAEVRRRLSLLGTKEALPLPPSEILSTLALRRTDGVRLDAISYEHLLEQKGEGKTLLRVGGFAEDRASLLAFIHSLESEQRFVAVDSPISNLVRDRSLRFGLEILTR